MATYSEKVASLTPVAHWRLGEATGTNAADETGNHDGTYNDSPLLGQTGLLVGDADTAANFTSPDYVGVADHDDFIAHGSGDWTLCCWFKSAQTIDNNAFFIGYSETSSPGNGQYGFGIRTNLAPTNEKNRVMFYAVGDGGSYFQFYGTSIIAADNTKHFAVARVKSGVASIWLDGVKENEVSSSGVALSAPAGASLLTLAGFPSGGGDYTGLLDEASLHGSAVSDADIADLWDIGSNGPPAAGYIISGTVELDGSPVEATLRLYLSTTGALIEEVDSDPGDGSYTFGAGVVDLDDESEYFVMCHYGDDVRPLAHGPVSPVQAA